jgi:hypothetical protein
VVVVVYVDGEGDVEVIAADYRRCVIGTLVATIGEALIAANASLRT